MDAKNRLCCNKKRVEDSDGDLTTVERHKIGGVIPPTPEEQKIIEQIEEYKPSGYKKHRTEHISFPAGRDKRGV